MKDLPGQLVMPFAEAGQPVDVQESAARALCRALPPKATCNVTEAAVLLSVCPRTVARWIENGTLLCQYANALFEAQRKHPRPVMRLPRPFDPARDRFLSVEELRLRNSNLQG